MGGLDGPGYGLFKRLFKEGFEAARKHSDSLISQSSLLYTLLIRKDGEDVDGRGVRRGATKLISS